MIPDLQSRLETQLPEKYKEILNRKDTIITEAAVNVALRPGAIELNDAKVGADGFNVQAEGKMDFKQNISFNTKNFFHHIINLSFLF